MFLIYLCFPDGSDGKASACDAGDPGSIPGSEDTLEKEMAIHSSTLAWKIPWMGEPGRLQSMGLLGVGHDWATSLSLYVSDTQGVVVQSLSGVWLFATPWTSAHQASQSFTISWSLLKLMSIELVMPLNHLILCHSLLLLPSTFPNMRVFFNQLALHIRRPLFIVYIMF